MKIVPDAVRTSLALKYSVGRQGPQIEILVKEEPMKGRLVLAASILLLSLKFAVGQVMVGGTVEGRGTNCSQKTQATQGTERPLNQHLQSADPYQTA